MRQEEKRLYIISVITLTGVLLTFKVDNYDISNGFVSWKDPKTNLDKIFPISNCQIEEVRE